MIRSSATPGSVTRSRGSASIARSAANRAPEFVAQARRASEECVFMLMGKVVEHTSTDEMFVTPKHQETADYIEGRYG